MQQKQQDTGLQDLEGRGFIEEAKKRDALQEYPSLARALRALYPEHPWRLSKFRRVPRGQWDQRTEQKDRLAAIGQALGVNSVLCFDVICLRLCCR